MVQYRWVRAFQHEISSFFPFLCDNFGLPGYRSGFPIRIRIRRPNWSGFGSETLEYTSPVFLWTSCTPMLVPVFDGNHPEMIRLIFQISPLFPPFYHISRQPSLFLLAEVTIAERIPGIQIRSSEHNHKAHTTHSSPFIGTHISSTATFSTYVAN